MTYPLKVLIVEDERLTAKCLKLDLEDLGADALEPVAKGEDAIDIANEMNPDLILMDIRLSGGLDGIEAAEEIMQKKRIPIVFMTGYATEHIKERAQKINPFDFLEKPVNIDRIKQIIDQLEKNKCGG